MHTAPRIWIRYSRHLISISIVTAIQYIRSCRMCYLKWETQQHELFIEFKYLYAGSYDKKLRRVKSSVKLSRIFYSLKWFSILYNNLLQSKNMRCSESILLFTRIKKMNGTFVKWRVQRYESHLMNCLMPHQAVITS